MLKFFQVSKEVFILKLGCWGLKIQVCPWQNLQVWFRHWCRKLCRFEFFVRWASNSWLFRLNRCMRLLSWWFGTIKDRVFYFKRSLLDNDSLWSCRRQSPWLHLWFIWVDLKSLSNCISLLIIRVWLQEVRCVTLLIRIRVNIWKNIILQTLEIKFNLTFWLWLLWVRSQRHAFKAEWLWLQRLLGWWCRMLFCDHWCKWSCWQHWGLEGIIKWLGGVCTPQWHWIVLESRKVEIACLVMENWGVSSLLHRLVYVRWRESRAIQHLWVVSKWFPHGWRTRWPLMTDRWRYFVDNYWALHL